MVCSVLQSARAVGEVCGAASSRFSQRHVVGLGGRDDAPPSCDSVASSAGTASASCKRLDAFLRRFDLLFAFDAIESNFLGSCVFGVRRAFLRLVNDDSFKLFFFVEEVGNVKECIAFQSDVDESGLHSGKTRITRPL